MPCATLVAEPIETYSVLSSFENASVRVAWPPVVPDSLSTIVSGLPLAFRSPGAYGKRTTEFTLATYRYVGFAAGQSASPYGRARSCANTCISSALAPPLPARKMPTWPRLASDTMMSPLGARSA